jgi:hypothetical protein
MTALSSHPLLRFVDLSESEEDRRLRVRTDRMPDLATMSVVELRRECERWRATAPTLKERRYEERNAYRYGFIHSYWAFRDLKLQGFVRETERLNILEMHAGRMKSWAVGPSTQDAHSAPPIGLPSWWDIRQKVFARDGRVCEYCGCTDDLQIDHVTPVCEGGLPLMGNLRVLCKPCNMGRNSSAKRAPV